MAIRKRGNGLEVDVQVTLNGQKRRYRETISGSFDEARSHEARVKADLLDGIDPTPFNTKSDGPRLPLEASLEKVWERYWSNGGQARTVRSNMAVCVEFFGKDKCLSQITAADMDDFIIWMRQKDYAPSTIRQKACVMSKAFRHFHRRGNLDSIPLYELPTIGDNERDRVFTREELQAISQAFETRFDVVMVRRGNGPCGQDFSDLFAVLYSSAARPSELRRTMASSLKGANLLLKGTAKDAEGKRAAGTKTLRSRVVPLSKDGLLAFHRLGERYGDAPFAWATPSVIRHAWDWLRVDLRIPPSDDGFIPYAYRHTRATHLYAATRDLVLVQKWLGHADIKMTLRYAKLQPGDLERARDLLEEAI